MRIFHVLLCLIGLAAPAAAEPTLLRLGLLKFGTVSWEIEVVRRHGLDRAGGVDVQVSDLANGDAGKIALLGGSVDVIVSDWLWVARQRAEGGKLAFLPYSAALGAVMVPAGSPLQVLTDLKGRRLGVAGGPLDKSWLLLKALAARQGLDLEKQAEVVYAAPPLLNQQVEAGRLDAVLTYWHYAARLEAKGLRSLLAVEDAAIGLGVRGDLPWIGYVVRDDWAAAHPAALRAFFAASLEAKRRLAADDGEWPALKPLMRAEDEATFNSLRAGYRRGIPVGWGAAEEAAAARLFGVLAEAGGAALVGAAKALDPATFHPAGRFGAGD